MLNLFKKPEAKDSPTGSGSFLPTEYIEHRQTSRLSLIGTGLLIIVMAGVVGAFLVTSRHRSAIRIQQEQINTEYTAEAKKIEQLKKLETQRKEMMDKAEVTAALLEKVPRSILLAELITRMPKDVTLLEMELKSKRLDTKPPPTPKSQLGKAPKPGAVKSLSNVVKGDAPAGEEQAAKVAPPKFEFTITLTGVASVNNDIAEYLGQLQACSLLGGLELQYIQQTMMDDINLRRFQIVASIRANADAHDLESAKPVQAEVLESKLEHRESADPASATADAGEPKPAAADAPAKEGQ